MCVNTHMHTHKQIKYSFKFLKHVSVMVTHDYTTNTQEANTEGLVRIQGQSELCSKLKASLGYKIKLS